MKVETEEAMEFRSCHVLTNGIWVHRDFEKLIPGDRFRMIEPDGTHTSEWIATSIPVPLGTKGNFMVECDLAE